MIPLHQLVCTCSVCVHQVLWRKGDDWVHGDLAVGCHHCWLGALRDDHSATPAAILLWHAGDLHTGRSSHKGAAGQGEEMWVPAWGGATQGGDMCVHVCSRSKAAVAWMANAVTHTCCFASMTHTCCSASSITSSLLLLCYTAVVGCKPMFETAREHARGKCTAVNAT